MKQVNEVLDVLLDLTAAYTVERDSVQAGFEVFGEIEDPDVIAELAVMNELIERAERVIKTFPEVP